METVRSVVYISSDSLRGYGLLDFSKLQDPQNIESSVASPYMAYIVLFIESSEDGQDIKSARAIFNDGNQRYSVTLNSELQNIALFLNSETLKEGTLVDKISQYLSFYNEDDTSDHVLPFLSDTTGESGISTPKGSAAQLGIDAFVIGIVSYLSGLKFLLEDAIYRNLPFHFTLPYYSVNENAMNCNMFKYMSYPATAIATHTTISGYRILFEQILTFCNEWGPMFDEGPKLDFEPAILDTVAGYCKLTISDLSDFQRQMLYTQDKLNNVDQKITNSVDMAIETTKSQIDETMSRFQNELAREFERKEEEMRYRIDILFNEKLDDFKDKICDLLDKQGRRTEKRKEKIKNRRGKYHRSNKKYKSRSDRLY